jgi:anti-sigma factor ChrR (cupin superfamily)
MNKKRGATLIALALLSPQAVTLADGSKASKPRGPVPMPAADLKWTDLDPRAAPGVKVADLWGDHSKGPFGAMFKLPAGFAVPLHTHTHDMRLVIISGTYIQGPEGKTEFVLGPGSALKQPGGNYKHTTRCDKSSDCVFFVESNGPFDLLPVDAVKKQ